MTPISPTIYQLNYKYNQFDAKKILSSSPKQQNYMYKVTPHPLYLNSNSSHKKPVYNLNTENKENIQSNFDVFDPV